MQAKTTSKRFDESSAFFYTRGDSPEVRMMCDAPATPVEIAKALEFGMRKGDATQVFIAAFGYGHAEFVRTPSDDYRELWSVSFHYTPYGDMTEEKCEKACEIVNKKIPPSERPPRYFW